MKLIPLSQNKFATVDDEDFAYLSLFTWSAVRRKQTYYALRHTPRTTKNGNQGTVYMHRDILPSDSNIDHVDGDGLNNSRQNLRPCTQTQNNANQRPRLGCASQYKGVREGNPPSWRASIVVQGKEINLGSFAAESDAARAYDEAARTYFGEFSRTNFQLDKAA